MDSQKIPTCVGFILDGNRRWAREKGVDQLLGHRQGLLETFTQIARDVSLLHISHMVVYMFSTENWNRNQKEVDYLMDLFREAGKTQMKELQKENMRIKFVGQRERFSTDLQTIMAEVETESQNKTGLTIWVCLSYGGRAEILRAVNALLKERRDAVTEEEFSKYLWTSGMPDPDLIIRTGGEKRLSGFLPWQSVYSELFFTRTYWPDFTKEELLSILEEYAERERRHGK